MEVLREFGTFLVTVVEVPKQIRQHGRADAVTERAPVEQK